MQYKFQKVYKQTENQLLLKFFIHKHRNITIN